MSNQKNDQTTYKPFNAQGYPTPPSCYYPDNHGSLISRQYSSNSNDSGYSSSSPITPVSPINAPTYGNSMYGIREGRTPSMGSPIQKRNPMHDYSPRNFDGYHPRGSDTPEGSIAPRFESIRPGMGSSPSELADDDNDDEATYKRSKKQRTAGTNPSVGDTYTCLHPYCGKGFKRSYDLGRHVKTHYSEDIQRIDCKEGWCGRRGRPQPGGEKGGFTRLDHYTEHLRKVHMKDIPKGRGSGKVPTDS